MYWKQCSDSDWWHRSSITPETTVCNFMQSFLKLTSDKIHHFWTILKTACWYARDPNMLARECKSWNVCSVFSWCLITHSISNYTNSLTHRVSRSSAKHELLAWGLSLKGTALRGNLAKPHFSISLDHLDGNVEIWHHKFEAHLAY